MLVFDIDSLWLINCIAIITRPTLRWTTTLRQSVLITWTASSTAADCSETKIIQLLIFTFSTIGLLSNFWFSVSVVCWFYIDYVLLLNLHWRCTLPLMWASRSASHLIDGLLKFDDCLSVLLVFPIPLGPFLIKGILIGT